MILKTSDFASFLNPNKKRKNLTAEEIIALDYYECISYLYRGKEKPVITGFKEGVNIWLETSVGPLELDEIPHNKSHLTNNVHEIEVLMGENDFEDDYIIKLINQKIDESWK